MSVPLSCLIITSYGARPVPAIARESCALAETMARYVARGTIHEDVALCAVVLDAVDRMYVCRPEHVHAYCRDAIRAGVTAWHMRRDRAAYEIGAAVWPLAKDRADGLAIMAAANGINDRWRRALTRSEVLAECRRICAASQRRTHVRGR